MLFHYLFENFYTASKKYHFNEYDRKVFNEGQVLTAQDLKFADDVTWDSSDPKSVYSIHNEGDETILTISHSTFYRLLFLDTFPSLRGCLARYAPQKRDKQPICSIN